MSFCVACYYHLCFYIDIDLVVCDVEKFSVYICGSLFE